MPALDTEGIVRFAKLLNNISLLSFLAPVFIGFRRWPMLGRAYRVLIGFALISGCVLGTLTEIGRFVWHNNIIFTYLAAWSETIFLSWAFYEVLTTPRARAMLLGGGVLFVLVAAIEWKYFGGLFGAQLYTRTMQSVLLIGAALMYFEQILRELRNVRLEQEPMFLVSVGVTLYYSGALMVFVLEDSMHKQHQTNQIWTMYIIQFILLILLNALLTKALWNASQPQARVENQPLF